jgi:hypothetical protein
MATAGAGAPAEAVTGPLSGWGAGMPMVSSVPDPLVTPPRYLSDPRTTDAWRRGAQGARCVGPILDALAAADVVVLHGPVGAAAAEHLVIAPAGVIVIDVHRHHGRIGKGTAALALEVAARAGRVRGLVPHPAVPVLPVLCLVGAKWPLAARPIGTGDVRLVWPTALPGLVARRGPLDAGAVRWVARLLAPERPAA